ncbi:MAG: 30S ribosomal protein S9 [Parcubacteria group bacterium]|nr:30S ribosomal protein S9 [Parcubacteria group bacterium]
MTTAEKQKISATHYIESVGRRKNAIARVRIFSASKYSFEINDREFEDYFPVNELRKGIREVFESVDISDKFKVTVLVKGGGISAQADAVALGIARALEKFDPELRGALKKEGLLKRDARVKERKKPGLKKARKASQWSKR